MARKKLEGKDKIISLANKLIKAINEQGESVMRTDVANDFGHIDVWVQQCGSPCAFVEVTGIVNGWSFKGKAATKIQ